MLIGHLTHNWQWTTRTGRRIHHGLAGAILTTLGLALMLDDIADCRHWRRDWQRRPVQPRTP